MDRATQVLTVLADGIAVGRLKEEAIVSFYSGSGLEHMNESNGMGREAYLSGPSWAHHQLTVLGHGAE